MTFDDLQKIREWNQDPEYPASKHDNGCEGLFIADQHIGHDDMNVVYSVAYGLSGACNMWEFSNL